MGYRDPRADFDERAPVNEVFRIDQQYILVSVHGQSYSTEAEALCGE